MIRRRFAALFLSVFFVGTVAGQHVSTYTVKSGDTLYGIARANGTSVNELKRLNELTGDVIRVGQQLRLPAAGDEETDLSIAPRDAADEENPSIASDRDAPDARTMPPDEEEGPAGFFRSDPRLTALEELAAGGIDTHVVRAGETFYGIAAALGTKAYVLDALNDAVGTSLEPGTPIIVPVDRDGRSGLPGSFALGTVTVIPDSYAGRPMEGGESYDPADFVVAHRDLPFDTIMIVENPETGRASFARVAERGPVDRRHLLAVSGALASEIGIESGERVRIRLVE